ncbi:MAG: radical SAM protein [Chloroflexi bacterium]|nr:radical SAM protein [Chloroflexota bacterium]
MNWRDGWSLAQVYLGYTRRTTRCSYPPTFLGIETSGSCNLRCVMCPQSTQPQARGLMDFGVFRTAIDEVKGYVINADLFGGGEPLLHPEIVQMVEYASRAGIRVRLHTNATRLTEKLSTQLINAGVDFLSFSFDGYDKETYESVRVNARFEETLENVKTFLRIKKERNAKKPYTVLQTIEPDGNYRGLRHDFRQQFASLPLNEFKVIAKHNYGGKVGGLEGVSSKNYSPCTFLWYASFVLWDGTIVPCCVDWWAEYPLGKVPETKLLDAWNGEMMLELRRKLAQGQYSDVRLCRGCDRLWRKRYFGVPGRSLNMVKTFVLGHMAGSPR